MLMDLASFHSRFDGRAGVHQMEAENPSIACASGACGRVLPFGIAVRYASWMKILFEIER